MKRGRRTRDPVAKGAGPAGGPTAVAFLAIAPLTAASLFFVWTRITTVQLGYRLSEAAQAHERLLEENRALRLDVAALKGTVRLEQLAKERFHLSPPGPDQVVELAEKTP